MITYEMVSFKTTTSETASFKTITCETVRTRQGTRDKALVQDEIPAYEKVSCDVVDTVTYKQVSCEADLCEMLIDDKTLYARRDNAKCDRVRRPRAR